MLRNYKSALCGFLLNILLLIISLTELGCGLQPEIAKSPTFLSKRTATANDSPGQKGNNTISSRQFQKGFSPFHRKTRT